MKLLFASALNGECKQYYYIEARHIMHETVISVSGTDG